MLLLLIPLFLCHALPQTTVLSVTFIVVEQKIHCGVVCTLLWTDVSAPNPYLDYYCSNSELAKILMRSLIIYSVLMYVGMEVWLA